MVKVAAGITADMQTIVPRAPLRGLASLGSTARIIEPESGKAEATVPKQQEARRPLLSILSLNPLRVSRSLLKLDQFARRVATDSFNLTFRCRRSFAIDSTYLLPTDAPSAGSTYM